MFNFATVTLGPSACPWLKYSSTVWQNFALLSVSVLSAVVKVKTAYAEPECMRNFYMMSVVFNVCDFCSCSCKCNPT